MDQLAERVARLFRAELLTKQWLMGVRRGWLHLMGQKPSGWPAIFKAFDTVRDFIENLEDQVKYVRRGPYSSHGTMTEGEELDAAFKKLKEALAEKRRSAQHWFEVEKDPVGYGRGSFTQDQGEHMRKRYEESFGELLTTYVPTKVNPAKGQWNRTREAPLTELLDKVLEILRKDAARLQEAIDQEKHILERGGEIDSPTEETFKDPAFKEFAIGRMKVIVTDPKGNGHFIRPYVRLLDIAHQLTSKKGFGALWYGTLFLQSADYHKLEDYEKVQYERAGYQDLESTAGTFHSGEDVVVITAPADDRTIKTIVHELGHRYWFKFMSGTQRARFADLLRLKKAPELKGVNLKGLEDARKKLIGLGRDQTQIIKDFEDDFRSAADSAEVEKTIKEYLPKFKTILRDNAQDIEDVLIGPLIHSYEPSKEGDPAEAALQAFEHAEEKFKRHMLPETVEGAWKHGMSDGLNKWIREAMRLHWEMIDVALEYLKHVGRLGERQLDPDTSKVMPVSDYGQTNPEEAFAEAFAFYVMGKDMTRDQVEMFKSVLAKNAVERVLVRFLARLQRRAA